MIFEKKFLYLLTRAEFDGLKTLKILAFASCRSLKKPEKFRFVPPMDSVNVLALRGRSSSIVLGYSQDLLRID